MTAHAPRLVNAGIRCDTAYCAECERSLYRHRTHTGKAGLWRAAWSRSAECTGPPLVVR